MDQVQKRHSLQEMLTSWEMALRIYNQFSRSMEEFRPQKPPLCRVSFEKAPEPAGAISALRLFCDLTTRTLIYLGLQIDITSERADLHCGLKTPKDSRFWIKPSLDQSALYQEDSTLLSFCLLKTHYRKLHIFSAADFDQAHRDLSLLREITENLKSKNARFPNPTALASYKQRLRNALFQDLNFPTALEILKDALRPGALSPGTQTVFFEDCQALFGLSFL